MVVVVVHPSAMSYLRVFHVRRSTHAATCLDAVCYKLVITCTLVQGFRENRGGHGLLIGVDVGA